jgi:hypothetical protein
VRAKLGLDLPAWQRYLHWLSGVVVGDLGQSHRTGEMVLHAIASRLPVSIELMLLAQLGALAIGVPLGILCAARANSPLDRARVRRRVRPPVDAAVHAGDPADLRFLGETRRAPGDRLHAVHGGSLRRIWSAWRCRRRRSCWSNGRC